VGFALCFRGSAAFWSLAPELFFFAGQKIMTEGNSGFKKNFSDVNKQPIKMVKL
jgi:hypothetical protein